MVADGRLIGSDKEKFGEEKLETGRWLSIGPVLETRGRCGVRREVERIRRCREKSQFFLIAASSRQLGLSGWHPLATNEWLVSGLLTSATVA